MEQIEDIKSRIDLKAIKSSYIKKRIFSFLNEKQNLKMIIYSKELQKICSIGIEDYKKKVENIKQAEKMEKEKNI